MRQLLTNKIRTPDGTILESRGDHDYQVHKDKNGESYMVDGGTGYLRRNLNKIPFEELSVYTDDPHDLIREQFTWGTRGPNGDQPIKRVALKDLDIDHVSAIIETQKQLPPHIIEVFVRELLLRQE